MTTKERVVALLATEGYDFWTACAEFERVRQEVLHARKPLRFHIGHTSFTLKESKP